MENSEDSIVDSTLNIMSESIGAFDNTLGRLPIYKNGHNLGGFISRFIDRLVDSSPQANQER